MIVNQPLAAWLADPAARAATDSAMRSLAAGIARTPAVDALRRGVGPAAGAGATAVLALARAFIEDDAMIAAVMQAAIAAAAADPFCRPSLRATRNEVQDGLLLFSRPELVVQLAVIGADALAIKRRSEAGRAPIAFTGQRSLFRFLKGGGASLSIWTAPAIEAGFSAPAGGRCRLRERRRLADGEVLELDGRRESFLLEGAESDLVYLFASTPLEAGPVGTEYDGESLELVAASSTDDAGSRTQMMLALLRSLGRSDAAPLFAEQLSAPHFHARWQAMREMLALDAELALPHLRALAASDPHAEVRAAAAETLAAFFPDRPAIQESPCPA
ncbi:MAG TPA: HEAT repeat domain-containing protein [Allosphingosinicella sp.]